jgi:hypothetical protein
MHLSATRSTHRTIVRRAREKPVAGENYAIGQYRGTGPDANLRSNPTRAKPADNVSLC